MSMLRNSAHYFRDYFRLSAADSGRIWQGFSPEARYGYLAALLQWSADETDDNGLSNEKRSRQRHENDGGDRRTK
ncbi:hypothetical protein [Erwinia sp. JUb26]|uniref:hypothetical protein n=1 Tax=Erwinia sp. JUb26 TaxID=2485126 RepID=UPI000F475108|nr:hypothetical protein [Erwinia sp. JUb26]ROR09756.1 hypothetical protein EC836_1046 [Erwinia sp. JUb26]